MGNKINLQQLARILAQKTGLSQKDAETFLKEFFDSIIHNVTADKLVKIKGLGTFKLIEVLDRESVNVNTGERIVIPGHTKLSFTPETALKDLINKPFADFQTVVINEGTSLEEMEKLPEEAPLQLSQEEETEPEEGETAEQEEPGVQNLVEEEKESEVETLSEPEPIHKSHDEPKVLYGPPPVISEPKPARPLAKILAWIAGIALLCLVCFFAGRTLNQKSSDEVPVQTETQAETPDEASVEEIEYAQVPDGEYKIVGTRKTHVMKPGDYLSKIAIEEYGDKEFTKYIIVHNVFPDPDNVPVDMEIKLPELEKVK